MMIRLNKILIVSSILGRIAMGFSFADNSDCGIFGILSYSQGGSADNWFTIVDIPWETSNYVYSEFLTVEQQKNILTKNDLNTALLNLKKYCCTNQLWGLKQSDETCKNDKTLFNDNALDSPYLFDHIFDVMMRRLNWLTGENDIYVKTAMTVDKKWQERRDRISDKAKDLSWSDAQSIINKYKEFWWKTDKYDITEEINWVFWQDDKTFLKYVIWSWWDDNSKKVADSIKNYDNRTLYDRYKNVCALSRYFYSLLNLWKSDDKNWDIIRRLRDGACDKIVQAQIDGENAYVQLVIQRSSNLFLTNSVKWYVWYLYDRWNKLKTLRKNTTDRWLDVVRAVPNLQKQCVK